MFKAFHGVIIVLGATACDSTRESKLNQVAAASAPPVLCPPDESTCSDEGAAECAGDGIRTCLETAGCLRWGLVARCPSGTACAGDDLAATCQSSCPGSTRGRRRRELRALRRRRRGLPHLERAHRVRRGPDLRPRRRLRGDLHERLRERLASG